MRYAGLLCDCTAFALAVFSLPWMLPQMGLWIGLDVIVSGGLTALGLRDLVQTKHSLLRNYPLLAHLRFLQEKIRPEIRQYFSQKRS